MTLTGEISLVKRVARGRGVVFAHLGGPAGHRRRGGTGRLRRRRAAHPVRQVRGAGERPTVPGSGPSLYGSVRHRSRPDGGGVAEGDLAELFGRGHAGGSTAADWADATDTIDYEILSAIRGRTVRRYVGGEA